MEHLPRLFLVIEGWRLVLFLHLKLGISHGSLHTSLLNDLALQLDFRLRFLQHVLQIVALPIFLLQLVLQAFLLGLELVDFCLILFEVRDQSVLFSFKMSDLLTELAYELLVVVVLRHPIVRVASV